MEKPVEVRYAGVTVGRAPTTVREVDATGVLIGITEPLPVGTSVTLTIEETTLDGTVVAVAESQESGRSAMRVRLADTAAVRLVGGAAPATAAAASVAPAGGGAPAAAGTATGAGTASARATASPADPSTAPATGTAASPAPASVASASGAPGASQPPAASSSSGVGFAPPAPDATGDPPDAAHGASRGPDGGQGGGGKKNRRKNRR